MKEMIERLEKEREVLQREIKDLMVEREEMIKKFRGLYMASTFWIVILSLIILFT